MYMVDARTATILRGTFVSTNIAAKRFSGIYLDDVYLRCGSEGGELRRIVARER